MRGLAVCSQDALPEGRRDREGEPVITTKTTAFQGTLDYIFVSPLVGVVSVLDMPYGHVDEFAPIPDARHPSDHIAMVAKLTLR